MRLTPVIIIFVLATAAGFAADPLPIDPLWKSDSFRKSITGSFGIDSRIEPRITVDEEFYLDESAKAMAADDRKKAIKTLADSPLLEKSAALQFNLATLQFEEGETEKAMEAFEAALKQFPNFRDAHRNLAVALVQEEKYEQARGHLIRAVELGSGDGLTVGLLGYCHSQKENARAALNAYRLASLTQPDERQWKIGEAQALQSLERHREANSIFQQVINEKPDEFNLWQIQADTLIRLDQHSDAIANLELVHRANALPAVAVLSLGHLYLQADLPDLAMERYENALAEPEPPELERVVVAVEMLTNQRDFDRSRSLIKLIEEKKYSPTGEANKKATGILKRSRAFIELENGDAKKGAEELEAWLRSEPTDSLGLILLARFKENADLREEAEMLLEQAAGLPDHQSEALLAHGQLLVNARDYAGALEKLEKAAELDPSPRITNYLEAVRELVD